MNKFGGYAGRRLWAFSPRSESQDTVHFQPSVTNFGGVRFFTNILKTCQSATAPVPAVAGFASWRSAFLGCSPVSRRSGNGADGATQSAVFADVRFRVQANRSCHSASGPRAARLFGASCPPAMRSNSSRSPHRAVSSNQPINGHAAMFQQMSEPGIFLSDGFGITETDICRSYAAGCPEKDGVLGISVNPPA